MEQKWAFRLDEITYFWERYYHIRIRVLLLTYHSKSQARARRVPYLHTETAKCHCYEKEHS